MYRQRVFIRAQVSKIQDGKIFQQFCNTSRGGNVKDMQNTYDVRWRFFCPCSLAINVYSYK